MIYDRIATLRNALVLLTVLALTCGVPGVGYAISVAPAPSGTTFGGYTTCQNQYQAGVYVCSDFASDFQAECTANGIQAWTYSFGPDVNSFGNLFSAIISGVILDGTPAPPNVACSRHQINIVQMDFSACSKIINRFCAIEPQSGSSYGCWTQAAGSPSPPQWIINILLAALPGYNACVAQYGYYGTLR